MIDGLKPYPIYKKSDVPWLGEIPEHWELRRMKTLFFERKAKGFPKEPLLAATQTKGVVRKDQYENRTVLAQKDLHLLKLVRVGDFVISLRSFQGGIEYAREQGIISPAYTILYLQEPNRHGWFGWLFKSKPFVENLSLYVTGIRQGQNIDYEKLSRSELPLPPSNEQIAIVNFLDYADRKIRRYIQAKQKLIKLLEEQKQVIIHRAVTCGLDPNVHLKPSGVEWLGDIPEHWHIKKLKYLVTFSGGGTPSKAIESYWNGNIPWVSPKDMKFEDISDSLDHITEIAINHSATKMIEPGAVLIVVRSGILQHSIPVAINTTKVTLNQDMKALVPNGELTSRFLRALIQGNQKPLLMAWTKQGATVESIEFGLMANSFIPIPPIHEQNKIIEYLEKVNSHFEKPIRNAKSEINVLYEFVKRIVADVVTGKLDVREAAAKLSDEISSEEMNTESTLESTDDEAEETDLIQELEEVEA